jgi:hypothetical protein
MFQFGVCMWLPLSLLLSFPQSLLQRLFAHDDHDLDWLYML